MSREELQHLVGDFRKTLEGLRSHGVYGVSTEGSAGGTDAPDDAPKEVVAAADDATGIATKSAGRLGVETCTSLAQVREQLGDCRRCSLSEERNQIVFGCGSESARIMFVGEAPGAEEDKKGQPFVGAAGQLLDKMIVAMGYSRESVYIANVLKCRPPNNRNPKVDEIAACESFLAGQIRVVAPEVIVTLGKPAAHLLLKSSASMGALRGVWQDYSGTPVMPTYHPAYLLREPAKKRDVWADLQQVMKRLAA